MPPLVIAHHLIWTAYGWWLPNDPRGSMSHVIRSDVIGALGELHHGRKKVQPTSREIREFYREADKRLRHELMTMNETQRDEVAAALGDVVAEQRYTVYACAVMSDHVHMVIRKHKHPAEDMIAHFQEASRSRLRAERHRPMDHPVWGGCGYKVFLDHPEDVHRTIKYVEDNPIKGRLPKQQWAFVKHYDNWPLHVGHSPNSPYATALKAVGRYP